MRDPVEKELSDKRSIMDRPPLQSRPATTTKSRMYMAGLQQIESQRGDSRSREKDRSDSHNKTAY